MSVFLQDLIHDLKSELSGNFETLVLAMLKSPAELDAFELHHAIAVSICEEQERRVLVLSAPAMMGVCQRRPVIHTCKSAAEILLKCRWLYKHGFQ